VAAVFAVLILAVALVAGALPAALGYEALVVLSGSMEPTIHVGSLAVVAPALPADLVVGDVITYRAQERPDQLVTHRLVGIDHDDQGRLRYATKGDANNTIDQVTVDQNAVLGRVTFSVPFAGYLVDFARRPEGKVVLIGLPALLLVLDYGLAARRRRSAAPAALRDQADELIARGRLALNNGATKAALDLFDRAIAAEPHRDEAWLLKATCFPRGPERLAILQAGLTVNPGSAKLKKAVEITLAAQAAAG
jgi:signal peptidase